MAPIRRGSVGLAAAALARAYGVEPEAVEAGLRAFRRPDTARLSPTLRDS